MEEREEVEKETTDKNNDDDYAADVEKVLTVVVKRRKTIPTKCMELIKQTHKYELLWLEKAKVKIPESEERENFKQLVQGLKRAKSFQFFLDDLHEAEQKLEKHHKRIKEINSYLEKRKKYILSVD